MIGAGGTYAGFFFREAEDGDVSVCDEALLLFSDPSFDAKYALEVEGFSGTLGEGSELTTDELFGWDGKKSRLGAVALGTDVDSLIVPNVLIEYAITNVIGVRHQESFRGEGHKSNRGG